MTDLSEPKMGELAPQMNIKGYTPQPQSKQDMVNQHKEMEERILRHFDKLKGLMLCDPRWLQIARTHIEEGFMALNRSVFQPQRIELPEDTAFTPSNGA